MSRNVYSDDLFQRHALNGASSFIVSSSYVCVLRSVAIWHGSGAASGFAWLTDSSDGHLFWLSQQFTSGTQAYQYWEGRIVIPAGTTVNVITSCALDLHISGYLLELP